MLLDSCNAFILRQTWEKKVYHVFIAYIFQVSCQLMEIIEISLGCILVYTGGFATPSGSSDNWFWQYPCSAEPINYTNWQQGEPNNHEGVNEDALCFLMSEKWVDAPLDVSGLEGLSICYVCEC